jgi:hypothetical protein
MYLEGMTMRKFRICWAVVVLACLVAGCGSSGIETGLPSDMKPQASNPTPDMGPSPNTPPADAAKK